MAKTKLRDDQKTDSVDLTGEVTGVLGAANGGTGISNLAGQSLKVVRVKADQTGFELADQSAGGGISENDAIAYSVAL